MISSLDSNSTSFRLGRESSYTLLRAADFLRLRWAEADGTGLTDGAAVASQSIEGGLAVDVVGSVATNDCEAVIAGERLEAGHRSSIESAGAPSPDAFSMRGKTSAASRESYEPTSGVNDRDKSIAD